MCADMRDNVVYWKTNGKINNDLGHVYMYVYACVYVFVHVCVYTHVCVYVYAYLCIECGSQYQWFSVRTVSCMCMCICVHMYAYAYVCKYIHMFKFTFLQ